MAEDTLTRAPALVFGGSRGIGAAIVRALAHQGRPVALTYASSQSQGLELAGEIEAGRGRAAAIEADSADADAVRRAVEVAVERFGPIGVLVVNAGVLMGGLVQDFALADFDRMCAVNIRGVFAALHYAAPHMLEGGRIITIGSNTAEHLGGSGSTVYAMTKAAVAQLVRGAALDLAPRRITVANVQPGPVETDMTATLTDIIRPRLPLGRMGQPKEIASLVAWLAGPNGGYVSGASLTIDGAWTA